MIVLTKIDGSEILLNSDDIEFVEKNHDTTISLKTGRKIIVKQNFDEIIEKVVQFRKSICSNQIEVK